jgi:hypothetical protein
MRAVLLVVALLVGGCGYRAIGVDGVHREDVQTVAVPAVALQPMGESADLETPQALTAALVRRIEEATPYRVAPPARADSRLRVTLVRSDVRARSRDRTSGLPSRVQRELRAEVVWTDLRDGRQLLELRNFGQSATRYPTLGEDAFVTRRVAAERLAAAIVDEMGRRW